ncbi:PAS domain-containing protein [Cupriavidus basilensis]
MPITKRPNSPETLEGFDGNRSAVAGLESQRDRLARIIVEEMFQFAGLLDRDGRILAGNRAALESVGLKIDDVRGKPLWETP